MNPQAPQQPIDTSQFGEYSDWAKDNLAKGASVDQLHQTLGQYAPKQESNPIADWLPTIGAIAAPVVGGLLAPATGGLSLLASAGLSGLGGAAGQVAKDTIQGKDIGSDVLGAGVENALGAGVGGVLGKIGGAILPKASGLLGSTADKLLVGQAPKGALTQDTAKLLRTRLGVNGINDESKALANNITGGIGQKYGVDVADDVLNAPGQAITKGVARGLQDADAAGVTADLTDLPSVANDLLRQNQVGLNNSSFGSLNSILKRANVAPVDSKADVTSVFTKGTSDPIYIVDPLAKANTNISNAYKLQKDLESLASQAKNSAFDITGKTVNEDAAARFRIFKGLADHLEGKTTGATTLTEANKAGIMENLASTLGKDSKAYQYFDEQLRPGMSLKDVRSASAPLVELSQAANGAQKVEQTAGTTLGKTLPIGAGAAGYGLGGPAGGMTGYVVGKTLESPTAQKLGTKTLGKLSEVLGDEKAAKMVNTLGRVGGVLGANAPTLGAAPVGTQGAPITSQLGGAMQGGNEVGQGQNTIESILQQMQEHPFVYGNQLGGVLSALAPQLQKNAALESSLASLPQGYANAGGAQGLGGIGSVISGMIPGTAANAYQGEVDALSSQLAQSLGISPDAARNLLPGLLQNEQTAGMRQNVLGNLAGSLAS